MKHKVQSNIWKYYAVSLLGGAAFFYNAIYTWYWKYWDLNFTQVGFMVSTALLTALVLEIPTGVFADLYGRKKSMVLSAICNFIAISFFTFGSSFWIFTAGFVFGGAAAAFGSGAGSALFFDSLKFLGIENQYIKHSARLNALFICFDIISGFLAPLMFEVNVRWPYYVSWLASLFAVFLQLTLYELPLAKATGGAVKRYLDQTFAGLKIFFKTPLIFRLSLLNFVLFVGGNSFAEIIIGPFMSASGFTLKQFSVIGLIGSVIQTSTTLFSDKFENKLGNRLSLFIIAVGTPLTLAICSFSRNFIFTGLITGIYYSLASFADVVIDNYLNLSISDDSRRATVLSIGSMFTRFLALFMMPLFGNYADFAGPVAGLVLISVVMFVAAPLVVGSILRVRVRSSA